MIRQCHEKVLHGGVEETLTELLGCERKSVVRKLLHSQMCDLEDD